VRRRRKRRRKVKRNNKLENGRDSSCKWFQSFGECNGIAFLGGLDCFSKLLEIPERGQEVRRERPREREMKETEMRGERGRSERWKRQKRTMLQSHQ
jgi:hypothetical protein